MAHPLKALNRSLEVPGLILVKQVAPRSLAAAAAAAAPVLVAREVGLQLLVPSLSMWGARALLSLSVRVRVALVTLMWGAVWGVPRVVRHRLGPSISVRAVVAPRALISVVWGVAGAHFRAWEQLITKRASILGGNRAVQGGDSMGGPPVAKLKMLKIINRPLISLELSVVPHRAPDRCLVRVSI